MKDKHKLAYMKCCKVFAECSDDTRLHVGTVIVKNNRIISCGYKKTNSCLTHETYVRGKDMVEIRVGDCIVYEVNGFYLED